MALASGPVSEMLARVNSSQDFSRKVEDESYLQNAVRDLKLAKALEMMD